MKTSIRFVKEFFLYLDHLKIQSVLPIKPIANVQIDSFESMQQQIVITAVHCYSFALRMVCICFCKDSKQNELLNFLWVIILNVKWLLSTVRVENSVRFWNWKKNQRLWTKSNWYIFLSCLMWKCVWKDWYNQSKIKANINVIQDYSAMNLLIFLEFECNMKNHISRLMNEELKL